MVNLSKSTWWPLLAYLGLPVLVGVILLIIEYKTRCFARQVISFRDSGEQQPNPFAGKAVTPIAELENPLGDWMQIAQEVRTLIEESEPELQGPVRLYTIKPKRGGKAELWFGFLATATGDPNYVEEYEVTITVDSEGRIAGYNCVVL